MSEDITTTETVETTTGTAPEATVTVETQTGDDARVTKANAEAAKYRKELRAAQAELEKVRTAGLSEAEKAIAEAEAKGRTAAQTEFGQRLVRAEFKALAAGRIANLDDLLEDLNLAKFVGDDGEPDLKAIEKAVQRLAPAPATEETTRRPGPRPDLSQGGSANNTALNSDDLTQALRAAVGA
jgi:hypothetical protein